MKLQFVNEEIKLDMDLIKSFWVLSLTNLVGTIPWTFFFLFRCVIPIVSYSSLLFPIREDIGM